MGGCEQGRRRGGGACPVLWRLGPPNDAREGGCGRRRTWTWSSVVHPPVLLLSGKDGERDVCVERVARISQVGGII